MFEGIFTTKTKKKNDERFMPGQKEGNLFGGSYEDSGFLPTPSQFVLVESPNKSNEVLKFEENLKKLADVMNLKLLY